jgi:hypothetical protein
VHFGLNYFLVQVNKGDVDSLHGHIYHNPKTFISAENVICKLGCSGWAGGEDFTTPPTSARTDVHPHRYLSLKYVYLIVWLFVPRIYKICF